MKENQILTFHVDMETSAEELAFFICDNLSFVKVKRLYEILDYLLKENMYEKAQKDNMEHKEQENKNE